MANRILRDCTDSEKVNTLSCHAEVFFYRLIQKADDYGCFHGNPRLLNSYLYPLKENVRDADISRWMAECHKAGVIAVYEVACKQYIQITDFKQQLRQKTRKFPEPPNGLTAIATHMHSNCIADANQLRSNSALEVEVETEVETEGEGELIAQERDPPPPVAIAGVKASKKNSVGAAILARARADHRFQDSEFFNFAMFEAEFAGTDYAHCDLKYYYNRMKNWADSKGIKRKDWIAQARNFMLGDAEENKLKLKNRNNGRPINGTVFTKESAAAGFGGL